MCGSETLTMVVSRSSMKAAMVTTTAISQGLPDGRQLSCSALPSLTQVHHRTHGQPQRQGTIGIEPLIDHDLYGDSLHDLHEVTRGIFGREGGEARAAAVLDALHVAGQPISRISVDLDVDRVAGTHAAQLRLFVVGRDPHLRRDDEEHVRSGRYVVAELH